MMQNPTEQTANKEEPKKPRISISELKQVVCKKLQQIFSSPLMEERLSRMAGGDMSRVAKNLTSFLAVITEDDGGSRDNKKYYCECSMTSLTMCFLESMNMQLPFDSRKLVSMVIYDWEVELDISYKGFIYALSKHYDNAYVDAKLVFEDDKFECEETGGKATFRHVAINPFRTIDKDFTKIAGGYCYFSYTVESGEPISRIVRMSRDDILMIKSKAKTKNVWNDFPSEMGTKALIRRGSKIPFAAIDLDIDVEEVGNRHYDLAKPDSVAKLENLMKAQEEIVDDKKPDPSPTTPAPKAEANPGSDKTAEPAPMAQAPAQGTGQDAATGDSAGSTAILPPEEESEHNIPSHITDADFEEVPNAGIAPKTPQVTTPTPKVEVDNPQVSAWDGKTIFSSMGKPVVKDWESPGAALKYLTTIINARKHKASRLSIIEANSPLIARLIKDGQGTVVADLHKLADQGE